MSYTMLAAHPSLVFWSFSSLLAVSFISSGSLFHGSTALTGKENFLGSVRANWGSSLCSPPACLVFGLSFLPASPKIFPCCPAHDITSLWIRATSCFSLLFSCVSSPSSLQHSLYSLDFSPATILTVFSCTRSRTSLSPTGQGDPAGEEKSKCGLT